MRQKGLFMFIIDTDKYAGNFEREMCAYMTGETGECEVGEKWARIFELDHPELTFEGIILKIDEDDYKCRRPVCIVNTESLNKKGKRMWIPNSVGIYFEEWPTDEEVKTLKERAEFFTELYEKDEYGEKIKILGFRKITRVVQELESKI